MKRGYYWVKQRGEYDWVMMDYDPIVDYWFYGDKPVSGRDIREIGPRIPMPDEKEPNQ